VTRENPPTSYPSSTLGARDGSDPMDDPAPHLTSDASDSTEDDQVDLLLRAVAHAPPRTPPPEPARPGDRWGASDRYVIEARLGRGGMGTVYSASDTLLHRIVALKVIDPGSGDDEAHRARLLREARIAAGIEHERVARVYDVGEHQGSLFVAMELLRGVTLRRWMAGRAVSPGEVLAVVGQIAEGLAALHAAGVFHRDLKPENVMLHAHGGVKLLDFGLAGQLVPAEPRGEHGVVPDGHASSVSLFRGTPGYMAPEQYAGERADSGADVFALGVIVHELVVGERPFRGATMTALLAAARAHDLHLDGPAWQPFPPALPAIVARMLEPNAANRYADGREVLAALEPFTTTARPVPSRSRRGLALGVVAALTFAAMVAGPRVSRALALRRALARPPPMGMALVNEGAVIIGQDAVVAEGQCAFTGPKCNPQLMRVMHYQVPSMAVTVPPFYLDQFEVTNEDLVEVFMNMSSSLVVEPDEDTQAPRYVRFNAGLGQPVDHLVDLQPPLNGIEYEAPHYKPVAGRERWPAAQITWFGAHYYCAAVGKRLPSENEWEAAARGAANRPYPWGFEKPRCGEVIIPSDGYVPMDPLCPKLDSPAPVDAATQDVTPQGIHDLGGNVSEWVETAFAEGWRGAVVPTGAPDPPRIFRGGAFFLSLLARTSARNKRPPGYVAYDLGFRCASDVTDTNHP
jgi:formylglycine-generating enzyme required for sulfatase activity/predicted Ser/Thr protein kinase